MEENRSKIFMDMPLVIDGMGIVFCSEMIANSIENGSNFFQSDFSSPEQVAMHVKKGDITGFCTGSGGRYFLKVRDGYPNHGVIKEYPTIIRLAIDVKGNAIHVKDLFELMEWEQSCPVNQIINLDNGYYHITLCTARPESGIIGDDQIVYVYLNKLESMPELSYKGVPQLVP